jgi:hypothetical protein
MLQLNYLVGKHQLCKDHKIHNQNNKTFYVMIWLPHIPNLTHLQAWNHYSQCITNVHTFIIIHVNFFFSPNALHFV